MVTSESSGFSKPMNLEVNPLKAGDPTTCQSVADRSFAETRRSALVQTTPQAHCGNQDNAETGLVFFPVGV